MQVARPRSSDSGSIHADRTRAVADRMTALAARLKAGGEFEYVRAGRWRHLVTGHHVETGYSYGEGRIRVFLGGGRAANFEYVVSGRDDDLDGFHKLFPVSSLKS